MNNSIWLYILVWLIISVIVVFILRLLRRFLPFFQRIPIIFLSAIFLAAIFTWWLILAQRSIPPQPVAITFQDFSTAGTRTLIVGDKDSLVINAVPKPNRLYVLIHPHSTMRWYLQNSTYIARDHPKLEEINPGHWEAELAYGPPGEDCGLKFDLIALASREPWIVDVLRSRIVYPETEGIEFFPVLNQSDLYTVTKECESSE